MSPIKYLQDWAKDHPAPAAIIGTGIAVFAAVAVVAAWGITPEAHIASAAYILGAGLIVWLLATLLSRPLAATVGGGFVAFLIVGWIGVFVWSKWHPYDRALQCVVYFLEPCGITSDAVAEERSRGLPTPPAASVAPPQGVTLPADRANFPVQIRFAGFARDRIVALAKDLAAQGWTVNDANRGGERATAAVRMAEVRYGSSSAKASAEALAQVLNGAKIVQRPVTAVPGTTKTPQTLEVLIGLE